MPATLDVQHYGRAGGARVTLREICDTWPPTVSVGQGASALGVARATLYEAIRTGKSPVKTITVLGRIVVITADLIRVLKGDDDVPAA